jgi:hypothetical protein
VTPDEYNKKNIRLMRALLDQCCRDGWPVEQQEKDIYNLKCILYGIRHSSKAYRSGHVATLKRAIERLEKEKK